MSAHIRPLSRVLFGVTLSILSCGDPSRIDTPVTPSPPPPPPPTAPPPTGIQLADVDVVFGTDKALFTSKANGADKELLAFGDYRSMAVSGDGTRLAYVQNSTLFVSRVDGVEPQEIIAKVTGRPEWSPDQKRIVVTGEDGLYVVELSSKMARRITNSQSMFDGDAVWSPDGKRIAFTRFEQGSPNKIGILDVDDGNENQLPEVTMVTMNVSVQSPAWSPDNSQLGFVAGGAIQLIDKNGKGITTKAIAYPGLVITSINDWSADGESILFTAVAAAQTRAYLGNFTGGLDPINASEEWGAAQLQTVERPVSLPNFSETVVFVGPYRLPFQEMYIFYPDGRITLRAVGPVTYDFNGTRVPVSGGFHFHFDLAPTWMATAKLDRNKLTVTYNDIMELSDFGPGVFTYWPGAVP